jgi:hypothetical protein
LQRGAKLFGFLHPQASSEKISISGDHFDRCFAPYRNGNQPTKKKGKQ